MTSNASSIYQIITSDHCPSNVSSSSSLSSPSDETIEADHTPGYIAWVLAADEEPIIRGPTAPTCAMALVKLLEALSALVSLRLQRKFESFGRNETLISFGTRVEDGGVLRRTLDFAAPVEEEIQKVEEVNVPEIKSDVKGVGAVVELLRQDVSWYEADDEEEEKEGLNQIGQVEKGSKPNATKLGDDVGEQANTLAWLTLEGLVPPLSEMQFVAPLRTAAEINIKSRTKGRSSKNKIEVIAEEQDTVDGQTQPVANGKEAVTVAPSEQDPNMVWMKKSLCVIQV
jgi:hypothetical protein